MRNGHGIDLDEVIANATEEGIDLSEITLFYTGTTAAEVNELKRLNLLVRKTDAKVIAKFDSEGRALYPEKVSEVYYLGA